jgi:orotidine-5'-phosphate decarboxylase
MSVSNEGTAVPVSPIIVALDVATAEEAVSLAGEVAPYVGAFKVGLGLLHGPGPGVIDALVRLDKPIFADAKLHDIPSQVRRAAYRLGTHGARWVTTHLSGGVDMVEAAVDGLSEGAGSSAAGILGVSVLTSLDTHDLERVGIPRSPGQLVGKMSKVAAAAGCEGVVCSPRELHVVGQSAPGLVRVTPGIRTEDAPADDQARTATPEDALDRGADWLVVGRPITAADDPAAAAHALAERIGHHRGAATDD